MKHYIQFIFHLLNVIPNTFIMLVNLKLLKRGMRIEKMIVLFLRILKRNLLLKNSFLMKRITINFQFGIMMLILKVKLKSSKQ
ncbi:hypothetical protein RhiirA1_441249 [Rhizophagus irregularis]|nr:hypothetical protein RhiirA1_441249 [Rhizophagus irregularis]PKY20372.1 hypothetical protein RhiirB3_524251 [Rhizophagus irregularis]